MSQNNKASLAERLNYWFDNRMAESFWAKVRLLFIVTSVFVAIIGSIAALSSRGDPAEAFLRAIMYTFGKGGALTLGADGVSPVYFVMMLLTILYCMFLSGILIGFITNSLRSKVDELGKGVTHVLEEDHILILGFSDTALALIGELIEADRNQRKQQSIVILGSLDARAMKDQLHKRFGKQHDHPKTKIICRTGDIYSFDDLKRCSIESSRAVIIDAGSDFEAVKAIIACSYVLGSLTLPKQPYMVTAISQTNNVEEVSTAAQNAGLGTQLEFLSLTDTLARIMVHTSRQPGLSEIFTELLNYSGHEFYLVSNDPSFPKLRGHSIEEINRMLKSAIAVGIRTDRGDVIIDDPRTVFFHETDALITVQEDDDDLQLEKEPVSITEHTAGHVKVVNSSTNALILGAQPILDSVLLEYGNYLNAGSRIHVADRSINESSIISERTRAVLQSKGIDVDIHRLDIENRSVLRKLVEECNPECVLVLSDGSSSSGSASDERIIRLLLFLREYRKQSGHYFSITSEMHEGLDKDLMSATGPDDFIIGNHLAALLMAQISQERAISKVFESLLSTEGYEVYIKDASWYVELNKEFDLYTVSSAVAERGDIFIGIHRKQTDAYIPAEINPCKYGEGGKMLMKYAFEEGDSFVVLSEDGNYSETR